MNQNNEKITIEVRVKTDAVGSECVDTFEFTRAEWNALEDVEKEAICRDVKGNMSDWSWSEKP